ncbi:DNA-binding FadR family transcriptional regulator [Sphingomonas prati]|uniref:DNA-binding FadR family transcriptional regulator n=1 Tax=Sphingomonas prati TaxID=1843237 RepID=A0A7W9F2C4_9SPHN|nr:DNA-binding FadR family transcriptional regulator [Sphingomonas prati]
MDDLKSDADVAPVEDKLPDPVIDAPTAVAAPASRGTGRRLHGAIAHKLGVAILSGEYAPGDVLSGEVVFSEALGVSRSAYREAVQVLSAKGLVESRPKAGTRVLPRNRWNVLDPDVLAWAFTGEPDMRFIRGLFELRGIVEPAAAALAAERRERSDLKLMKDALAGMTRHTLASEAGRAADRDFHDAVLNATGNDSLVVLSASIGAAVHWTTKFKQRSQGLPRNPIPDHRRVYDAIAAGNPAAASEAMRVLVDQALEDTKAAMKPA